MTIPKRLKRRGRKAPPFPPNMEEKAYIKPPIDIMVRNGNDTCKWCGRKMLSVKCQCGWVKPINK